MYSFLWFPLFNARKSINNKYLKSKLSQKIHLSITAKTTTSLFSESKYIFKGFFSSPYEILLTTISMDNNIVIHKQQILKMKDNKIKM